MANQLPRQVIVSSKWDRETYQSSVRNLKATDELVDDLLMGKGERQGYEFAPELVNDAWLALYVPSPIVRAAEEVDPQVRGMQALMTRLVEHPKLAELQEYTAGDPLLAAIGMEPVGDVLRSVLAEVQKQEQRQQQRQQPGQDPGEMPSLAPADDQPGDGSGEIDLDALLDGMDVNRKLHRALSQAQEKADEIETAIRTFGLDAGEWAQMDPERRLQIAEQLTSPKMRRLADMLGRMVRFSQGARQTKITDVPHTVFSVERGNNLRNVLPREFALLGQGGGAKLDFYRRYASRELAQYKKRGTEKAAKGPLIVLIDKSGSMHGESFEWAMGAAEAMRRIVAEDKRDYLAVFFAGKGDVRRFEFPQGKADAETTLAFYSVKPSGGTEFSIPLTEALAKASEAFDSQGRTSADIVLLSDGESHLTDQWIADFNTERSRVGVRCHAIHIGGASDSQAHRARELLEKISDQVVLIHDLVPESAGSVFVKL